MTFIKPGIKTHILVILLGLMFLLPDLPAAEESNHLKSDDPIRARKLRLPSGPDGSARFGAYYTRLEYDPVWDKPWRVGSHADVVVRFDNAACKFVFWRGTSYIPCWVTDSGVWYTNEFVERRGSDSPGTEGCVEPMSDKQCRFSHVRVIENNDARVVVHWRYAPVDVWYNHPFTDRLTGWSDWVDEYYTIYPDAVSVRKITLYTTRSDLWTEWQESIVVNQPGTMPEDNIELDAVTLVNLRGESKTYHWTKEGAPDFGEPKGANILRINLKAKYKPFAIVAPAEEEVTLVTPYKGHAPSSHFHFWDHWPVSQDATDGRLAVSLDRPSHSSLCHIGLTYSTWKQLEGLTGKPPVKWEYYAHGEEWQTKVMLHGMTDKPATDLAPLARSWLDAPDLELTSGGYSSGGYEQAEAAYQLINKGNGKPGKLTFCIAGSKERPIINPALVIRNWGECDVALELSGKKIERGQNFRFGHHHKLEGGDLIVWIKVESMKPIQVSLSPIK